MKIDPAAAELLHADRETDMMNPIVAFSGFANGIDAFLPKYQDLFPHNN